MNESQKLTKLFKAIDKKYENLSQEELDELYLEEQLSLSKQTGKQLDARKRNGYMKMENAYMSKVKKSDL